ncbi:MAG: hypothetical protein ABIV06_03325 [Thermoanaerobaculia bacterium]
MAESLFLGQQEQNTFAQLAHVALRAYRVELLAEGHLGYIMPAGGVELLDFVDAC